MNHSHKTKPTKPAQHHKKSRGGILVGLFLGLLLGLLCAFGVVWYLNKTPLPFVDKTSRGDKPDARMSPDQAQQSQQTPQPLPGKPGDKSINAPGEKPRFDFYKILPAGPGQPGQDTSQHPGDTKPATLPPATDKAATEAPAAIVETFYLQAGAFQKAADADNLKAKLAFMGLETTVMEGKSPDKGLIYRVRVGPYAKPDEMNRVRNQLAQNKIQATVVKIKENGNVPAESTTDTGNR